MTANGVLGLFPCSRTPRTLSSSPLPWRERGGGANRLLDSSCVVAALACLFEHPVRAWTGNENDFS